MNSSLFTDDEIKEQLSSLGFKRISQDKFEMFKKDLEKLILSENSMNTSSSNMSAAAAAAETAAKHTASSSKLKKVTFPDERSQSFNDYDGDDNDEEDENENDTSIVSITTTSSILDNKVIKRKVLRKSTKSSDVVKPIWNDLDKLKKDFNKLELNKLQTNSNGAGRYEDESDEDETTLNEAEGNSVTEYVSEDENCLRLNDHYIPINLPVKSFIRSRSSLSLRSNGSNGSSTYRSVDKSNPFKLFQEYKKTWSKHKAPGEKNHNNLRWSIREQMLEKHVIVKKQPKVYVPNPYTIPTEKKRQQLRWLVRSALANPI